MAIDSERKWACPFCGRGLTRIKALTGTLVIYFDLSPSPRIEKARRLAMSTPSRFQKRMLAGVGAAMLIAGAVQAMEMSFDAADLRNGRDINEVCAGCHGELGAGGKEGEYPRIAGQPASFIAKQLLLFRDRSRTNFAMVEYVDHRQMPDPDIIDISAYLTSVELPSKLPPADESAPGFNAYERLMAAKRVVQIPQSEGDPEAGKRLYKRECASCHGSTGQGDPKDGVPMLSGQYTNYLLRQVGKYIEGQRIHDETAPDDDLLSDFSMAELRDIFAHLSRMDD